ncbi:PE family protein [Mycobacterium tuberculosis]|nr:PE family protein [Mycobacterium tuberculosis]
MSRLIVAPDWLASAAAEVQSIGSALSAANAAAAAPTTLLVAAAEDEVSAAAAALFANYGREYQTLSVRFASLDQQFAQALNSAAASYQTAEATGASLVQTATQGVLGVINAPTEFMFGRSLIGDGADGTAASPIGEPGGICTATAETATPRPRPELSAEPAGRPDLSVTVAPGAPAGPAPAAGLEASAAGYGATTAPLAPATQLTLPSPCAWKTTFRW